MSEGAVTLTFPAKAEYLLLSRLALAGLARAHPFEPELLADLKLAVTEACGNAVRHAYPSEEGPVSVSFTVEGDRLEIVVEDRGSGLELPAAGADWTMPEPTEIGRPRRGMGMAIIGSVMDELDVAAGADGTGTVVRMTKYL